jgi:putative holliday junction resolvase
MPANNPSIPGRLAAVDYGTVRIGVAITDPERRLSNPLENYTRRGQVADGQWFRKLVSDERIVKFVVGLPLHLDGRESEKSIEAREFGRWLAETTGVPVVFFDERFTSAEAEHLLAGAKLTKKRRKERLDKLAAHLLLTAYLEAGQPESQEERGLDG